ncbi:FAD-dependent oxidoreductase [Leucobacter ruminantium]|uniref:FAD-dependent oxidoreductase n=1 Tax=Leucobacter ruminantium TaxID=1289170 RepID=A0A939LYF5_9MICO|nr:FAD-dependent oxidoreductase [Leucobacter ruminantium]
MSQNEYGVVVVGASVAAEAFATRLRELDYEGEILVVDRDSRMPYERPPLSKLYLTSPATTEIDVEWHETVPVTIAEATDVDADASTLTLTMATSGSARKIKYDKLVIATGATPIRLPIEPEGVMRLRTAEDSERIREAAGEGQRVGIIGAGAIGAELATSLSTIGSQVVILDKADRPLERLLVGHLGADVSSWLQSIGIDCRWSADIVSIEGKPGAWSVMLGDGNRLDFDLLVSAVGARPATAWLENSGLLTDGQLLCDPSGHVLVGSERCENIFGIGDVVTRQLDNGDRLRTESWSAAAEHGIHLAEHVAGKEAGEAEVPYFWTDVAGRKIQVLGTLRRDGAIEVEFENPARGAILYKVTGTDGSEGWIGINAQPRIAMLRMAR